MMLDSPPSKIFVIGFHRTGTRTIASCINESGLNVIHYPNPMHNHQILKDLETPDQPWRILTTCDGMADIVTVPYYKHLDMLYPNSKFILSTRAKKDWQQSVTKHFSKINKNVFGYPPIRKKYDEMLHHLLYGDCRSPEHVWSIHLAHLQDAHDYFNKTEKLLALNIFQDASTKRLSEFLGIRCRPTFEIIADRSG